MADDILVNSRFTADTFKSTFRFLPNRQCRGGSAAEAALSVCLVCMYVCVCFMCVGVFVGGVRARCVLEGMVM